VLDCLSIFIQQLFVNVNINHTPGFDKDCFILKYCFFQTFDAKPRKHSQLKLLNSALENKAKKFLRCIMRSMRQSIFDKRYLMRSELGWHIRNCLSRYTMRTSSTVLYQCYLLQGFGDRLSIRTMCLFSIIWSKTECYSKLSNQMYVFSSVTPTFFCRHNSSNKNYTTASVRFSIFWEKIICRLLTRFLLWTEPFIAETVFTCK